MKTLKLPKFGSCEQDENMEPRKFPKFGISWDNTPGITLGQRHADISELNQQITPSLRGEIPANTIPLFPALPGFPFQSCTKAPELCSFWV